MLLKRTELQILQMFLQQSGQSQAVGYTDANHTQPLSNKTKRLMNQYQNLLTETDLALM